MTKVMREFRLDEISAVDEPAQQKAKKVIIKQKRDDDLKNKFFELFKSKFEEAFAKASEAKKSAKVKKADVVVATPEEIEANIQRILAAGNARTRTEALQALRLEKPELFGLPPVTMADVIEENNKQDEPANSEGEDEDDEEAKVFKHLCDAVIYRTGCAPADAKKAVNLAIQEGTLFKVLGKQGLNYIQGLGVEKAADSFLKSVDTYRKQGMSGVEAMRAVRTANPSAYARWNRG